MSASPVLGHGIGLRHAHYRELLERVARGESRGAGLEWLEAISENFFEPGGHPRSVLRRLREHYPIALHGVSLALGSAEALDPDCLTKLSALVREIEPALVSDHLCWGRVDGCYAHDLLPMPFTEEALAHICERVNEAQERLARPLAIENVSSYLQFTYDAMSEWEFLSALVARTGCTLLLDVNNVFVSAHNHGFDAQTFITALPASAVTQIHVAGHSAQGGLYLDTHDAPVRPEVWALYRLARARFGPVSTCVEWDDELPPLARVVAESARAAQIAAELTRAARPCALENPTPAREAQEIPRPARAASARSSESVATHAAASVSNTAPSMRAVQARLWACIRHGPLPDTELDSRTHASGRDAPWAALVASDARASAGERLAIYARMYFARLHDCLIADFPKLAALLGQAPFRALARDYVRACPSRRPSLRHLGASLPTFLRQHPLALARPWLAELAALEWARNDVFDRRDEPLLSVEALRARAGDGFRGLALRLVHAHALIAAEHAVERTWRALHEGTSAPPTPERSARTLLVWRAPDLEVYHRALDPDEAELSDALARGVAFEAICEQLAAHLAPLAAAQRAAELLASWARSGLLRRPRA